MFFELFSEDLNPSKTPKTATRLSLSKSFKNYPSRERSAKIKRFNPPFQIFFTFLPIFLSLITQEAIISRDTRENGVKKRAARGSPNDDNEENARDQSTLCYTSPLAAEDLLCLYSV